MKDVVGKRGKYHTYISYIQLRRFYFKTFLRLSNTGIASPILKLSKDNLKAKKKMNLVQIQIRSSHHFLVARHDLYTGEKVVIFLSKVVAKRRKHFHIIIFFTYFTTL